MNLDVSAAWAKIQGMINELISLLPNFILALIVFTLFYLVARWVQSLVKRLTERHRREWNAAIVLGRLAHGLIVVLGLLIALSIVVPSFKAVNLIQLLGVGSVAIGFAFRDIFQYFLAGILLLLTHPFGIGDQIVADKFEGTVEDIQTRATMIKTYDGRRVVIPNTTLFTQSVIVNTAYRSRRSQVDIGIGYGDDIERARQLILEAISGLEGVLPDPPPDALVVEIAASSVNIRARWWTAPVRKEVITVQGRVITAIKKKLNENGIDLPFPTEQILFHDQTEETDGDRSRQREGWPAGHGPVPKPRNIAGTSSQLARSDASRTDNFLRKG